jgi:CRP-like cAMP-binding protein
VSARDHLGFLVLEGLLARDERLAGSTATELIGPGDILQPWTLEFEPLLVPRTVTWTALQPSRLAVLGPAFVAAIRPWPHLRSALLERAMQRCSRISTHHTLSQLSRVDARLLVLFWYLAERWGKVTSGGVQVPLRLSHEALGHLVGAKRPTVSLALRRLYAEGLVARRPDRTWLLTGSAEEGLARLGLAESERFESNSLALHR